jgi:hypothetical protein
MFRTLFVLLLIIHGIIHLLGFASAFHLGAAKPVAMQSIFPLSVQWVQALGIGWLLVSGLFLYTALQWGLKKEAWWMVATGAVLFSQVLIVIYWPDARFGTILNVLILTGIGLGYGSWSFGKMIRQERERFVSESTEPVSKVRKEQLSGLPANVSKWLERSGIVGKDYIRTAHLKQRGEMSTQPDGKWMPVNAEQYFRVAQPGFLWIADVKAAPFVHLAGRDKYENGRGHMLIKALSLFPVADARGKEIDQGTMLRYLAETVWFPTAALSPYIRWEEVNATRAKASMQYGGVTASGIFSFSPEGDVLSFEAQRYYDRKEGATLETWLITMEPSGYREFQGIRIPAKSAVTWKLKAGDFTWFRLEITDVVYNEEDSVNSGNLASQSSTETVMSR